MSDPDKKLVCLVCGHPELHEPAYEDGIPTFVICSCCGTEFGYDDAKLTHETLRGEWIAEGMRWWSTTVRPAADWDPVAQLKTLKAD